MRSSLAKLSALAVLVAACTTPKPKAPLNAPIAAAPVESVPSAPPALQGQSAVEAGPALPPRAELEHLEFLNARDPHTKLLLGYRLYCENARGPATEKWIWILQFAPLSPEAATARGLVQSVNSGGDPLKENPGSPACSNNPL